MPFDEEFLHSLEALYLLFRRRVSGRYKAERRSRRSGAGLEFADHRDYAPGDDLRTLDWNLYGRLERLMVRLFEEEEDLCLYFLLDCSRSMGFAYPSLQGARAATKLDYGKMVVAALAYIGLARLDRVSILPFAQAPLPALALTRGKDQIYKIFAFLQSLEPQGPTDLSSSLEALALLAPRPGAAVVISDLFDPLGPSRGLQGLRHQHLDPLVIQLLAPEDLRPTLVGPLALVDCESGLSRELTPSMVRRYQKAVQAFIERLASTCHGLAVPLIQAPIDHPFEELILRVLREEGVVG